MTSRIASLLTPEMTATLSGYVIKEVTSPIAPTRSFLLCPPLWDGENGHVLITFTFEGIILQGPLIIESDVNGMVSESKRTLDWFCSGLTEDEVCEAFLQQRWQYPIAERDLRVLTEREDSPGKREFIRSLADRMSRCEGDRDSLVFTLRTRGGVDPIIAGQVGVDFPAPEAGWLYAIQCRFAAWFTHEAH